MKTQDEELSTAATMIETLTPDVADYGNHEVFFTTEPGVIQRASLREFVTPLGTLEAETLVNEVPVSEVISPGETVYAIGF